MTAENPEDWRPPVDQDDVDAALEEIEREASNHNAEYAAGMRLAKAIFEDTLNSE